MLTYTAFTGINNVIPDYRQGSTDLLRAENVDIGLTGEIMRRAGFSLVDSACHRNLWQANGFMLASRGADLVAMHAQGTTVVQPAIGSSRIWFCNLPDGRVFYTNGLIAGCTDGASSVPISVPKPSTSGVGASIAGALDPGVYRYHLSFVRQGDHAESEPTSSGPVVLAGGLRLDGLPQLGGHDLNVYLSSESGEGAYLAGRATGSSFQFAGRNAELMLPCRVMGAQGFPVGTVTAYWRGRLVTAVGDVLWASRPNVPHLSDWRDYRPLGARITAIQPVDDGLYVGTEEDLFFLAGTTWDGLAFAATRRGPVVPGSAVPAPGQAIKVGDGVGAGSAMVCIAGGFVVGGFNGGQTVCLTENRYRTNVLEVAAVFREIGGIPQYIAVPQ